MMIERQTSQQVKKFQTDNDGKYINRTLRDFFKSQGILHDITAPYSPQSNRGAEQFNKMIIIIAL